MKSTTPITVGAAVASDLLSVLQIPGGASLQLAAEAVVAKVQRDAMNALCKELRDEGFHGKIQFDEHDVDPLVEMIFQFTRAVADGTAKANLQLLAQVIAGLKKGGQMSPDAFRKWRKVLEDLTTDELILVGCAYRVRKALEGGKANTFWRDLKEEMFSLGYSRDEVMMLCASVSRTGLVFPLSALSSTTYMDSRSLIELGQLADLSSLRSSRGEDEKNP